jgi:hypothetical protein
MHYDADNKREAILLASDDIKMNLPSSDAPYSAHFNTAIKKAIDHPQSHLYKACNIRQPNALGDALIWGKANALQRIEKIIKGIDAASPSP